MNKAMKAQTISFLIMLAILYPVCTFYLDKYNAEVWHSYLALGIGFLGGVISIIVALVVDKHTKKGETK